MLSCARCGLRPARLKRAWLVNMRGIKIIQTCIYPRGGPTYHMLGARLRHRATTEAKLVWLVKNCLVWFGLYAPAAARGSNERAFLFEREHGRSIRIGVGGRGDRTIEIDRRARVGDAAAPTDRAAQPSSRRVARELAQPWQKRRRVRSLPMFCHTERNTS